MTTTKITSEAVQEFRRTTGLPMMRCKQLLIEADGDQKKAMALATAAGMKPNNTPLEERPGCVGTYQHHNRSMSAGVLVRCDSDTFAKTAEFKKLCDDLAMHVAVANPAFVSTDKISAEDKRSICEEVTMEAKAKVVGKSVAVSESIAKGLLSKRMAQVCLLDQPFVRDEDKRVEEVIADLSARSREMIEVERFWRLSV